MLLHVQLDNNEAKNNLTALLFEKALFFFFRFADATGQGEKRSLDRKQHIVK